MWISSGERMCYKVDGDQSATHVLMKSNTTLTIVNESEQKMKWHILQRML
jgi:hypothetical protein